MSRVPTSVLASVAALGLATGPAGAVRAVKTDLDGLIEQSALIVEGQVQSVDLGAGSKTPRTRVVMQVERVLAGDTSLKTLDFELPMGLMPDGTVLDIVEAPRFSPGETYLVFYKRGAWNITPVAGWHQGQLRRVEHKGAEYYVGPSGHCVTRVSSAGFGLGNRIAGPVGPAGMGESTGPDLTPGYGKLGACLPAEVVRGALGKHLDHHPIDANAQWTSEPAQDILEMALAPHARQLAEPDQPGLLPTLPTGLCGPDSAHDCEPVQP